MIAVDTSVIVAAFAPWHADHDPAKEALRKGARLVAHAAHESYAVLTRLPPPYRATPPIVLEFLDRNFSGPLLALPPREQRRLLGECAAAGITGGGVYDALIAATARHAGATLVSLDRRALSAYEAIGPAVRLLQ